MTSDELNKVFALPGAFHFEDHGSLVRGEISLPGCRATVYAQGAHLTDWQPASAAPVLFLSERSLFVPGKAIRGGIPVCFPWFGPRTDGGSGPSHGFARTQVWELAFAALLPDPAGDRLHLTWSLGPTEESRSLGFDGFQVAYEMIFGEDAGRTLRLRFSVANTGTASLRIEEALHAYFAVSNVREMTLGGFASAGYLDKTDENREKVALAGPLMLTGETDRVFPAHTADARIHDPGNARAIVLGKRGSATTVVWSPWESGATKLADLAPGNWTRFVCVEAANTGSDAIALAPGEAHTLELTVSVEPTGATP